MTTPIDELKIRARLLRKALLSRDAAALSRAAAVARRRRWTIPEEWPLALCLNIVSVEAGFDLWNHARIVLGGEAVSGADMGRFWYENACSALLNHWFAGYDDARASLDADYGRYLFPYDRQFIVADAPFVVALGLDPAAPEWTGIGRDLVSGYGSAEWVSLVRRRLLQMRAGAVARQDAIVGGLWPGALR
jgi:hypothetical protein